MLSKKRLIFLLIGVALPLVALLAACGVLTENPQASTEPTLTPTATLDPAGVQAIAPRACQVGDWQTIQSERKAVGQVHWQQGSLLAWQPVGREEVDPEIVNQGAGTQVAETAMTASATPTAPVRGTQTATQTPVAKATQTAEIPGKKNASGKTPQRLAYLAPIDRTSWFGGGLMIATAPDFKDRKELAPNILVAGDLTWSPAGSWLAFLAFRPNEGIYTVMTVHADGAGLTDLFPADLARTDARTSQKAILGWKDDSTIEVIVSCGEECRNAFDISLGTSTEPRLTPTPIDNYHTLADSLTITRHTLAFDPATYPKNMLDSAAKNDPLVMKSQPNWSPDESMVDYLDKRGILWLLSIPDKVNYPLDIGLRDVIETTWSLDNQYLAVRAEDRLFVFQIPCDQK